MPRVAANLPTAFRGRLVYGRALVALFAAGLLLATAGAGRAPAPAQRQAAPPDDRYIFDSWGTEEGLPQTSVNSIVQTPDGYLWLATYGGLVRFDGVRFTVFDSENTPALESNRITTLFADRDGGLWIGAEGSGLTLLRGGAFTAYTERDGLPSDSIGAIMQDRRGDLWLASGGGVIRRDGGGRFTLYSTQDGLPDKVVRALTEDSEGNVWVGTRRGLARLNAEGRFDAFTRADGLPGEHVTALCPAREGGVWVGTIQGLARFDGRAFTAYTKADGLPDSPVARVLEDRAGDLWVGTTDAGLARLRGGAFVRFGEGEGLADEEVRAVAQDAEGNLWVGTNTGGLTRLKKGRVVSYTREDGLPADSVVPITEDLEGNLWVGATCGGLIRFRDGEFKAYTERDGLPHGCVWSLYADATDRSLWIGTWDGGLTRFHEGRFTTYSSSNSGLSNNVVFAVHRDRAGALWVGTGDGLNRFEGGRFTVYRTEDGLAGNAVRFITETRDGALWFGTTGGLSRLRDGRFTSYTTAEGLSHNFVRAVHEDADGALWVGTYGGGLNRLRDGKFVRYSVSEGLFDNVVSRIIEDARGNLWMSGNRGVFRVSRRELNELAEGKRGSVTSVSYDVSDGMASRETNGGGQPAGWRARDGRLWFPTVKGLVTIDPERVAANELPPPVAIERLLFDRAPVTPAPGVELPPGRGDLEVHYTALSFVAPEKVQFRYRLEGYDEDWVEAGARRVAYYTQLPPGEYRFRVIASNNDGVWNTEGASVGLALRPPFWRTWWFLWLASAAFAGLLLLAYRRRVAQLERARAAQEAFSRRLIESQEKERKRIAAELHDSLGQNLLVIKNRALLALNAPGDGKAAEQLNEISATASEAIDEVRQIAHDLRPYQLDSLGLTKALRSLLKRAGDSSGIKFSAEIAPIDNLFSKEDEINLYRIVQECVSNIVKHSRATEARVTVARDERGVVLSVRDDGRGFDPAARDAAARRGFGLTGISERARMLGGKQVVRSAPGGGTTVVIKIALGRNGDEG
jgi:signal transduction histidine kinase/sugar lactone lactonase YvrE